MTEAVPSQKAPELQETLSPEPLHVVFVDDDYDVRMVVSTIMGGKVNSLKVLATPQAVIDRFNEGDRPNVLLTDGEMPEMTGLQLARLIKDRFPTTTIVLISGGISGVNLDDSKQLEQHGIDLYWPKSQFVARVDELVDNIKTLRQQQNTPQNPT